MNRTIKTLEENKRKTLLANSKEAMNMMADDVNQGQQNKGGGRKKKKGGNKQGGMSKEQEDELIKKLEEDNKNMEKCIEEIKQEWEREKEKLN